MWKRMIFFWVMRGGDQLPPGSRSKIKELMKELKELDEDLEGKLHKAGFNLLIRHAKGDEVEKQKSPGNHSQKQRKNWDRSEQDAVSLTDSESRFFMKNKKGHKELSYNLQNRYRRRF